MSTKIRRNRIVSVKAYLASGARNRRGSRPGRRKHLMACALALMSARGRRPRARRAALLSIVHHGKPIKSRPVLAAKERLVSAEPFIEPHHLAYYYKA